MRKRMLDLLYRGVYGITVVVYALFRCLPHAVIPGLAKLVGMGLYAVPSARKLMLANIHCAMPELPEKEVRRIARASCFHLFMNMLEFLWMRGSEARIRRYYKVPEEIRQMLSAHAAAGDRIIFVNPHLGNWEASGVMAALYCGVDLVAIAKPLRNPYLNRLFNERGREKVRGLRIIFAKGAMRAAVAALRAGSSLGTLIDQNTRVRDGGTFVKFFGMPVASSLAPVTMKRFCDKEHLPCVILYGTSLRGEDGFTYGGAWPLSRPYGEFPDEHAVLQDLMLISERFIRKHPEQYLWFYHRFQHIPPDCPPELRARYPYYAKEPPESFYDVRKKVRRDGK